MLAVRCNPVVLSSMAAEMVPEFVPDKPELICAQVEPMETEAVHPMDPVPELDTEKVVAVAELLTVLESGLTTSTIAEELTAAIGSRLSG
jgi:hypothetical protein